MDNVTIRAGAKLRRVIVDRYNIIEPNTRIGYDLAADAARYKVTENGVVVVPEAQPYETARTSFAEES